MSDEELAAIRARVDAADQGPWDQVRHEAFDVRPYRMADDDDCEFIVHARDDVLALLAEVEHLRDMARMLEPMGGSLELTEAAAAAGYELASDWLDAFLRFPG